MSAKRKSDDPNSKGKKIRKVMSLSDKIKILDKLKNGSSAASLGSEYGVNESTIRYIRKAEDKIRSSVQSASAASLKIACVSRRDPMLEKMEKMLNVWIEDQTQKHAPLSGLIIRNKALNLYERLMHGEPGVSTSTDNNKSFQASRGWFDRFKTRFSLHSLKLVGESASADHEKARTFPPELAAHISSKGYTPDQVFNADETGLFWKKMPNRTYISKGAKSVPGCKAAKDRLTLLFCCNASGDFKCKPMLVYRALNPRALKNIKKEDLPVFWRANGRAWVTAQLFTDWFKNCFIPEVKRYLREKNVAFKVLLLVDNAPGHPATLSDDPNIEVMFLPPNTTSLLQPLDQGIIKTFKSYYTRRSFLHILAELENDPTLSVKDCWSRFSVLSAVTTIRASWDEVKTTTINACWKNLWPECVKEKIVIENRQVEIRRVVEAARKIGKEGFENIEELISGSNEEQLTLEELNDLVTGEETTSSSNEEEPSKPPLTTKMLQDILDSMNQIKANIISVDPDSNRSLVITRRLDDVILPYKELYNQLNQKKRQQSLTQFFKPKQPRACADQD